MRRKPQQAFARGANDAVFFERAMPAKKRRLYARWSRADDSGADRTRCRDPPPDPFKLVGEARCEAGDVVADRVDADVEQQIDRRAEAENADRAERAGFEAARVGKVVARAVDEFSVAVEVRPAVLQDV